jgi:hypothetical protein
VRRSGREEDEIVAVDDFVDHPCGEVTSAPTRREAGVVGTERRHAAGERAV